MLKMFVVIFLSSSLIWIIITAYFKSYQKADLIEAIIFGVLFGFSTVLFYRFMINKSYSKNLEDLEYKDLKSRQFRIIKSRLTLFEVKRKLIDSNYFRAENISFRDETLRFRKRASSFSWGENIAIRQSEINTEEEYSYEISSRPVLLLQWYDYGVNYRNINELEKLIC